MVLSGFVGCSYLIFSVFWEAHCGIFVDLLRVAISAILLFQHVKPQFIYYNKAEIISAYHVIELHAFYMFYFTWQSSVYE